MADIILKTTVLKSNPHVIREFQISEDFSISDMLQVAALVNQLRVGSCSKLFVYDGTLNGKRGEFLKDDAPLSAFFAGFTGDEACDFGFYYRYDQRMYSEDTDIENCWLIHVQYVGTAREYGHNKLKYPKLLRFHGGNIGNLVMDIRDVNEHVHTLVSDSYYYYHTHRELENYKVSKDKLNKKLKLQFGENRPQFIFDLNAGVPFDEILNHNPREIIEILLDNLNVYYRYGLSKTALIEEVLLQMDTLWNLVISNLSAYELENIIACLTNTPESDRLKKTDFPTLSHFLCIKKSDLSQRLLFPSEFIDFLSMHLAEHSYDQILRTKKLQDAKIICLNLYGHFTKLALTLMVHHMYPDEFNYKDIDSLWTPDDSAAIYSNTVMYRPDIYGIKAIKHRYSQGYYEKRLFYLPKMQEQVAFRFNHFSFSPETTRAIVDQFLIIDHSLSPNIIELHLCHFLYTLERFGYEQEEMIQVLKSEYGINGPTKELKKLVEIVKHAAYSEVRRMKNNGFTDLEIKYLNNKR